MPEDRSYYDERAERMKWWNEDKTLPGISQWNWRWPPVNGPLTRLEATNRTRASRRASAADRARLEAEDQRAKAKRARSGVEATLEAKGIRTNAWVQIAQGTQIFETPVQIEEIPDPPKLDAPVIGYRCFRVDEDGRLKSTNVDCAPWDETGINEARCESHFMSDSEHKAPVKDCHCGLYAWYTVEEAKRMGLATIGAVLAWGRIYAHKDGFRAQYARIIGVTSFCKAIGPSIQELEAKAKEFGETIPPEHRYGYKIEKTGVQHW